MKRNKTMKSMLTIKLMATTLLISSFLFSCEHQLDEITDKMKDKDKGHKNKAELFVADLHPLNNSGVTGKATFKYKKDGMFLAEVHAEGLVPGKVHPQHIHGFEPGADGEMGDAECPPMSAAGEDGLLTLPEGLPFYGPILVPLDDELVPLTSGEFPVANHAGIINYKEKVGYHMLVSAIEEMFPKGKLHLEKRSVVLHGAFVKDGKIVPAGTEGAEYIATLPVACGEIIVAGTGHGDGGHGGGGHGGGGNGNGNDGGNHGGGGHNH